MFGLTLDTLKAYLGYDVGDSSRDVQLQQMLDSAIASLQSLLGRTMVYGNYRDTLQYMDRRVYLKEWPIASLTTITLGDSPVSGTDYLTFLKSGYIHFKNVLHRVEFCEHQYLVVNYVGGFQTLPADMVQALYSAIQSTDTMQRQVSTVGGVIKRLSVYDVGVTDLAVPRDGNVGTLRDTLEANLGQYMNRAGQLGGWALHESELISAIPTP